MLIRNNGHDFDVTDDEGVFIQVGFKTEQAARDWIKLKGYHVIKDNINPNHYKQGAVECIVALEAATINKTGIEAVCTANIIKYLWRYEAKNGLEDVKKANWYLQKLIEKLKADQK